jgi:hypothetical protein
MTVILTNTSAGDDDTSLQTSSDGITSMVRGPIHGCTTAGVYPAALTVNGLGRIPLISPFTSAYPGLTYDPQH